MVVWFYGGFVYNPQKFDRENDNISTSDLLVIIRKWGNLFCFSEVWIYFFKKTKSYAKTLIFSKHGKPRKRYQL